MITNGKEMKIKLLLGSIGTVVILILVSFTNVVGLQSQSSESVINSPLFEYRTKKAINDTISIYHYQYITMNNILTIPLSAPDQRVQFVLRFVQSIVQMDDTTFNELLTYSITYLNKDNKIRQTNIAEIITGLKNIRRNPEYIIHQIANQTCAIDNNCNTNQQYTIDAEWIPGCLLAVIIELLIYVFVIYPIAFIFLFITAMKDCFHSINTEVNCCPCYRVHLNKYLYKLDVI